MRLFLDANVIFSAAHNPTGNAQGIFRLAEKRRCELVTSRYALEEAERNIHIKYPDRTGDLQRLVPLLSVVAEALPNRIAWAAKQKLRLKDAPILAAAVQARANVLVTGDRTHFGHLYGKLLQDMQVMPPATALVHVLDGSEK